jgi:predicted amidohydrolase
MRVALVQHDIVWEDRDATLAHLEPVLGRAGAAGARLIVLTEMFATGFSMRTNRTAEAPDGPSAKFLAEQAAIHDAWLVASVPEQPAGADRPFNTLLSVAPDGAVHRYRKIHPFSYSGEDRHFAAGGEVITVTVDDLRVTPLVCFDLRFAPLFWEAAARTDCFVIPANWPAARREHWRTLLPARAVENQAWVVGCNRVGAGGSEGQMPYAGDSAVIDPMGRTVASAAEQEALLVVDVDADTVADVRARFPFADDRREDWRLA